MPNAAKIIAYPVKEHKDTDAPVKAPEHTSIAPADDFFSVLAADPQFSKRIQQTLKDSLAEINMLRAENRWEDIVSLYYPVQEKCPELHAAGLDIQIRSELAFAMGHINQHEKAIAEYMACIEQQPEAFRYQSGLAYTLYDYLFLAQKSKSLCLPHHTRKLLINNAHMAFQKAQQLREMGVTNYYREGMLYKSIQAKPNDAVPLFKTAIANWEAYSTEEQERYIMQKKYYIKSLYNLASCLLALGVNAEARGLLEKCLSLDVKSAYISQHNKLYAYGKVLFALGNKHEALQSLQQAAAHTDTKDGDYIQELLARVYLALREPEKALIELEKVPAFVQKPYLSWCKSDVLRALGRNEDAKAILLHCLKKDGRSRHVTHLRLATLAYDQQLYPEVLHWTQNALDFHQGKYGNPCADALFWCAIAHMRMGSMENAAQAADDLKAYRPNYHFLPKLLALLEQAKINSL